jgi:hypothetical protein
MHKGENLSMASATLSIQTTSWGYNQDGPYNRVTIEHGSIADKGIFVLSGWGLDYIFQVTDCREAEVDITPISTLNPRHAPSILHPTRSEEPALSVGQAVRMRVGNTLEIGINSEDAGVYWNVSLSAIVADIQP